MQEDVFPNGYYWTAIQIENISSYFLASLFLSVFSYWTSL